jgi:hypothetical protein
MISGGNNNQMDEFLSKLKGRLSNKESDEKKSGPCPRCSGKGTIAVDSGNTLSGPAERESRNKTVPCPDCHGLPWLPPSK